MSTEHRLEAGDYTNEISKAALSALRSVGAQTDHGNAGRRRTEVDSTAVSIEQWLKRHADLASPLDRGLEPPSLEISNVQCCMVQRVDPRNKLRRTFPVLDGMPITAVF
jgi:hypothetical protein